MKYKYELDSGWYSLERIYNTKIGERIMRKDGTPAPPNPYANLEDVEDATQYWSRIRTVLADYRQELKDSGEYLTAEYIMVPTGRMTEVKTRLFFVPYRRRNMPIGTNNSLGVGIQAGQTNTGVVRSVAWLLDDTFY